MGPSKINKQEIGHSPSPMFLLPLHGASASLPSKYLCDVRARPTNRACSGPTLLRMSVRPQLTSDSRLRRGQSQCLLPISLSSPGTTLERSIWGLRCRFLLLAHGGGTGRRRGQGGGDGHRGRAGAAATSVGVEVETPTGRRPMAMAAGAGGAGPSEKK